MAREWDVGANGVWFHVMAFQSNVDIEIWKAGVSDFP